MLPPPQFRDRKRDDPVTKHHPEYPRQTTFGREFTPCLRRRRQQRFLIWMMVNTHG